MTQKTTEDYLVTTLLMNWWQHLKNWWQHLTTFDDHNWRLSSLKSKVACLAVRECWHYKMPSLSQTSMLSLRRSFQAWNKSYPNQQQCCHEYILEHYKNKPGLYHLAQNIKHKWQSDYSSNRYKNDFASIRNFRLSMVPQTSWSAGCLVEMTCRFSSSLSFVGRAMHSRGSFFNILITICLVNWRYFARGLMVMSKLSKVPSLIHVYDSRLKANQDNLLDKFDEAFSLLSSSSGWILHHQQKMSTCHKQVQTYSASTWMHRV